MGAFDWSGWYKTTVKKTKAKRPPPIHSSQLQTDEIDKGRRQQEEQEATNKATALGRERVNAAQAKEREEERRPDSPAWGLGGPEGASRRFVGCGGERVEGGDSWVNAGCWPGWAWSA